MENTMKRDLEKEEVEVKKQESSDTVCVACGIPMGQIFNLSDGELLLNGVPMSHLVSAEKIGTYLPAGKYGLTTIKKSQWDEILEKYGKCDFIKNGVIFAEKQTESAKAKGRELKNKRLGFEQADPKKGRTQKKSEED